MNVLLKLTTATAIVAMTSQPCLAAVIEADRASVAVAAASSASAINFDLQHHRAGASALDRASVAAAAISANAGQQTAETERKRRGLGTTTLVVIGGVVLLVVLLAAVASAAPSPGPHEGAFD